MTLAFIPESAPYAWRSEHGAAQGDLDFEFYRRLAQTAERGKFHIFFLGDGMGIREDRTGLDHMQGFATLTYFEATSLLSALASSTSENRAGGYNLDDL